MYRSPDSSYGHGYTSPVCVAGSQTITALPRPRLPVE